ERRGVREVLRPEGRGMTDPPQGFPGPSYPLRANPSFADLLQAQGRAAMAPARSDGPGGGRVDVPVGTTVLALKFAGGVIMAGDRRAVEGFSIADERIEKVFPADETSAIPIPGAAGPAPRGGRVRQAGRASQAAA